MRTSAGLRSVLGMRPGTSVSAVHSQDSAARTCAVTELWPWVASPKAQQVAWAAPVSRVPERQAAQGTGSRVPRSPGAGAPSQRTPQAPDP